MPKKNVLFFDTRESWFSRFSESYPTAFHAWNTEDAAEWIAQKIHAEESIDLISIGNIPQETDLFISWLMINHIPITEVIVHARNSDDADTIFKKMKASGYTNIAQYQFGLNWMKGRKPCPSC